MKSGKRSRSIRRKSHYDQVRVLSGWGGWCGAEYHSDKNREADASLELYQSVTGRM